MGKTERASINDSYIRDLPRRPLLNHDECRALHAKMLDGCEDSRHRLVENVLPWAAKLAAEFHNHYKSIALQDCLQEAAVGAILGVDRWEPDKGTLTTYTRWWVYQALMRHARDKAHMIRIPQHQRSRVSQVARSLKEHPNKTPNEIAKETGKATEGFQAAWALSHASVVSPDGFLDTLTDDRPADLDAEDEKQYRKNKCERLLSLIDDDRTRLIMRQYYLDDGTLASVAKLHGVSRERIRQIEAKALSKLRHPSRSKRLYSFVDS